MAQTTLTKPTLITNIDTTKADKYIPRLVNGELYKLEIWLPNILSVGGITSRERYDYRVGQYKTKNKPGYNSHIAMILHKIDQYKTHRHNLETQLQLDKRDIINAISQLKTAVDQHHENTHP